MADRRDDRVSRAYQELPDDEPAPAIDAAIQAAARRAVGARPGVARRWQIPLSIAAVLTLAVGLSLQVNDAQREAGNEAAIPAPQRQAPDPSPAVPAAGAAADSTAAPTLELSGRATMTTKSAAERSVTSELVQEAGKPAQPMADGVPSPEQQLEHIAELRANARHEEAERELAAFRRAFPDYLISEQWRRKVERPGP